MVHPSARLGDLVWRQMSRRSSRRRGGGEDGCGRWLQVVVFCEQSGGRRRERAGGAHGRRGVAQRGRPAESAGVRRDQHRA